MKNIYIILLIFIGIFNTQSLFAQNITGTVKGVSSDKVEDALAGASVSWAGTTQATITNKKGHFKIQKTDATNKLVVSFVGYKSDTISISELQTIANITLKSGYDIEEISVEGTTSGQHYSGSSTTSVQTISSKGLEQLPCCTLSESFENNASVDVSFTDALSGSKQIRMLGLSGIYSQIMMENMPAVRGLATTYGLSFVPGSWMESIQISKGAATVVNGYESTTGQINVELKKPHKSERLFVNMYANTELKKELNVTAAMPVTEKTSTMVLMHVSDLSAVMDHNSDGFQDMPQTRQYNFINRWKYKGEKFNAQLGLKAMNDKRKGGQIGYLKGEETNSNFYGIDIDSRQYEVFAKLGFPIKNMHHTSVGTQYSLMRNERTSTFGHKWYSGVQNTAYVNLIYQTIIKTTNNKVNLGASFLFDDYDEMYDANTLTEDMLTSFLRRESVPGVFAQYTYSYLDKFNLIAGLRTDFNSLYGMFITPRLHAKYSINHHLSLRASAGKAYRTANMFAENQAIMASSRVLIIKEDFKVEEAWNYGVSLNYKKDFTHKRSVGFSADYYRTDFINQIIGDIDANPKEISFYNLDGKSYANNYQVEVSLTPYRRLDFMAALRYSDVKTTMHGKLIDKPFVNNYKGLITISYASKFSKWTFDVTNQFVGSSSLPDMTGGTVNPNNVDIIPSRSPAFYILHAQITRKFKYFSVYGGAENLTGFKQENPIVSADNPFSDTFDASMIWGPIVGRQIFAGVRIKIK